MANFACLILDTEGSKSGIMTDDIMEHVEKAGSWESNETSWFAEFELQSVLQQITR